MESQLTMIRNYCSLSMKYNLGEGRSHNLRCFVTGRQREWRPKLDFLVGRCTRCQDAIGRTVTNFINTLEIFVFMARQDEQRWIGCPFSFHIRNRPDDNLVRVFVYCYDQLVVFAGKTTGTEVMNRKAPWCNTLVNRTIVCIRLSLLSRNNELNSCHSIG